MQGKKKALGRGLSALLEGADTEASPAKDILGDYAAGTIAQVNIDEIGPNPFQPRTDFDRAELADLALSIQEQGVIQPITIRKLGHNHYQLIVGERRLKAARVAGLTHIPAYIRVANDEQMLEMALVENIQREDLNPLEIAISFQRLIEECQIRQEDLSQRIGKDRSTISNYIRLLKLPAEVQKAIREKQIAMGHARALINIEDPLRQLMILKKTLDRKLSVRQVEELVRSLAVEKTQPMEVTRTELPEKYRSVKETFSRKFDSTVEVKPGRNGHGSIVIHFSSDEDLDRLVSRLPS
jgi:ParB family chromosome partitioning protein